MSDAPKEQLINNHKAPRIRSSAYPSYTLEYCIEFTKKIHVNFGTTHFIDRETLAKVLGMSVGNILTQLSSSVQYDLCEMKMKEGYKPSPQFIKIYKPINDDEKQEALVDCILAPEIYNKLINHFNGNSLPSIPGIATILFRNHNIAEAASVGAAKTFVENLQFVGLLDNDNVLSLNRRIDEEENEDLEIKELPPSNNKVTLYNNDSKPSQSSSEIAIIEPPQSYPIVIPLKNNRSAKLIIPEGYTDEDLNKITRFIDALRE